MKLGIALSVVALGTLPVSQAIAQSDKQTPANAHRFLTILSQQQNVNFELPDWEEQESDRYVGQQTTRPSKRLLIVADSQGCSTRLKIDAIPLESETKKGLVYPYAPREVSRPYVPALQALALRGIEWAKVTAVKSAGSGVIISTPTSGAAKLYIYFSSPDLAIRAAYALDVIRAACDPTADTAF